MTTLVLGATGATGRLLVEQLLKKGEKVKAMVRSVNRVPASWRDHDNLTLIEASVSQLTLSEMASHLKDCDAIACCLGHTLDLKGIYGKPRRLVRDAVRLVCESCHYNAPSTPVKFILMSTTGFRNRDESEPRGIGERLVISLLRLFLPPHPDNEEAAEHLRVLIGPSDPMIEWVVVRPDTLLDEDEMTEYVLHPSPTGSLFNPGKTSRINVAHFMARLATEDETFDTWKSRMPVVYNAGNVPNS